MNAAMLRVRAYIKYVDVHIARYSRVRLVAWIFPALCAEIDLILMIEFVEGDFVQSRKT